MGNNRGWSPKQNASPLSGLALTGRLPVDIRLAIARTNPSLCSGLRMSAKRYMIFAFARPGGMKENLIRTIYYQVD